MKKLTIILLSSLVVLSYAGTKEIAKKEVAVKAEVVATTNVKKADVIQVMKKQLRHKKAHKLVTENVQIAK
jgi:hypothetical protein